MLTLSIEDPRWSSFVAGSPDASPFHHPIWANLLSRCYGYRAMALVITDEVGDIRAGLPIIEVGGPLTGRRWVSLPFTDYCPLLVDGRSIREVRAALVDELRGNRIQALELRAHLPSGPRVHSYADAVRHTTVLGDDPDEVYTRFSRMHQRNIRKAERAGVRVERSRSPHVMQEFYRLHLLTRRRLGVPVQPFRFFRLLLDQMVEADLGFVLVARVNGEPAAAAVFLTWNGTMIYKYGASDPAYWDSRPNNLLFWQAIGWGCEHGYHTFDWGRTDLEDQGLRQFKDGWGAEGRPLSYSVIADTPPRESQHRMHRAVEAVIKPSPIWVCRAIGELFYKYSA